MPDLLALAQSAARAAGAAILEVYAAPDLGVEQKADQSPVTAADRAAHAVIDAMLTAACPDIPRLSEEGAAIAYAERAAWSRYWLIDPLDGTKEFIKKNGQFTVNIALIENGFPVLGVVYAPALDRLYWGRQGEGAFVQTGDAPAQTLPCEPVASLPRVVMSVSHPDAATRALVASWQTRFGDTLPAVNIGSSLKFCVLAEGGAEIYPRLAPTMEWDTAAGQAVAEAAGCRVVQWPEGQRLRYNKPDLRNPAFLVTRLADL